jgi:hypothetical protein
MHEYLTDVLARDRLAELRALAARESLYRELRPPRRPLRVALGAALVRIGHRLSRHETAAVAAERRSPA